MIEGFDPDVVAAYERETWSRCADGYVDTFAGITGETVPRLIALAEIDSETKLLDIGSGPGHASNILSKAAASVTGVDFSARMVEVAQAKYPDISFRQADAEQLPFKAASFDVVVANFMVHHLARPEVVFGEIYRVLKPGGRFVFAVWGAPEEQSSIGAFFGAVIAHHDMAELPHGPLFGVTERSVYQPMLSAAGLEGCQLRIHQAIWQVATLDPVIEGFWDWGNMAALPIETQEKIKQTTRENAAPFQVDGGYAFPHAILFGSAAKA
jgi:SAM-dependent methyltransferase